MKVYFSALLVLLSGFSLRAGTVTPEPFPPARLSNLKVTPLFTKSRWETKYSRIVL
jgi:hypothetical protein